MKKIQVVESVLKANDAVASANRRAMDAAGVLAVNVMSAPGSGKTSLLEKTIPLLGEEETCAVLVGDLQTSRDAERLGDLAVEVTQINTGRGCHLSATQVSEGLQSLRLEKIAFLFIENVGNMVCPAGCDLGEHRRVALLSVAEGDDKVAKYPSLFQAVDAILLSKIDLLDVLEFDVSRVRDDLSQINSEAPLIEISTKTSVGLDSWIGWLRRERDAVR